MEQKMTLIQENVFREGSIYIDGKKFKIRWRIKKNSALIQEETVRVEKALTNFDQNQIVNEQACA